MNKTIYLLLMMLAAAVLLGACNSDQTDNLPDGSTLANPASVYCQGLGYVEETRENELGQYGVCIFPDGSECDTWDFLAGRCGANQSYCAQQGYTLQANDTNIGTCVFSESASCNEFEYFNGECQP